MPGNRELESARKRIAERVDAAVDGESLDALISAALALEKRVSHEFVCKSCGQRQLHYVLVSDPLASARVLEVLLNQGRGRPREEEGAAAGGVTVVRRVVLAGSEGDVGLGGEGGLVGG